MDNCAMLTEQARRFGGPSELGSVAGSSPRLYTICATVDAKCHQTRAGKLDYAYDGSHDNEDGVGLVSLR